MSRENPALHDLTMEERIRLEERLLGGVRHADIPTLTGDAVPRPLSFAQESVWFFNQLLPGSSLYHIPQAFRLRGRLSQRALEQAFVAVVDRHEALRMRFTVQDGTAMQMPQNTPFALRIMDLEDRPDREAEVTRLVQEEVKRPFDLSTDLPVRACLFRLGRAEHILVVTVHHIVCDFGSLEILHRELAALYCSFIEFRPVDLPRLTLRFGEWADRQRAAAGRPGLRQSLSYWQDRLAGPLPVLPLPVDRPRGETRTFRGSRRRIDVPPELASRLQRLAATEGVTMYVLLLAAFQALLFRYSHQEDMVVGTPIGQRNDAEAQLIIGYMLNLVVLRTDLSGDPTFLQLLQRVRDVTVESFMHQGIPVEMILERMQNPRSPSINPLCQVVFQYLPSVWPTPALPGLLVEVFPVETATAKFELSLTLMESGGGFTGELEYNTDLFDAESVEGILRSFQALLESVALTPGEHIARIPLLSDADRELVLARWQQTATPYPRDASIHQLFEREAEHSPDSIAVATDGEILTYGELNRRANQLARFLRSHGAKPGGYVGMCLERSLSMIVALLAVLKAGAAYVPLDHKNPKERLSMMLADSGVTLVVSHREFRSFLPPGRTVVDLDQEEAALAQEEDGNLDVAVAAEDLAYVLYTSGSTGTPKGVAVPHRGVVRLVKETNYANFDPREVFLQFAPLSFDASTFEIWGPLLNGAKLVLYPPEFTSLEQLVEIIGRQGVTTLWLTAGLFHQVVEQHVAELKSLRQLLAGGDALSVPHVLKFLREVPACQLINGYGPTENTTFTCCYRFPQDWKGGLSAPIGHPVSNTQVFILDPRLEPVPLGVAGELCAAGDGLARGYLNGPNLDAEKFVVNPFGMDATARLYRTGDLCRAKPDGTIEFLGRFDDQVKVNGFRIHLQEVEAALNRSPKVHQAVVIADSSPAGRQLVAYVAPVNSNLTVAELRRDLARQLPSYMVPTRFWLLESLPLGPNGKVDRRALRPPRGMAAEPVQAGTSAEQRILEIWKEVLSRQEIGIDDDFFELGGHSLLAMRVLSRINQTFRSSVTLDVLFRAPTVRGLAAKVIAASQEQAPQAIPRRARTGKE